MLQKLREKPDHVKKIIALAMTAVLFSGIVFVWWSSFDARRNGDTARGQALSPTAGLKELFRGIVSDVQSSISGAPAHTENMNTPTLAPIATTSTKNTFDISGVVVIDTATSSIKKR